MLELFTFRLSHFSEKTRWMLDVSRIEYHETFWTPFFHLGPALLLGRIATTVPILKHRSGYVQDSTRILHWLDTNMPGFRLLPRDAAQREEALALEERFDRVGGHVLRYVYSLIMDDAALVTALWTPDSTSLQRRFIAASFPVLRALFRRRFDLSEKRVAHSREVIEDGLAFLDAMLADGREFLVGDALSAADITACALLAPLVGPDEHEMYSRADTRGKIAPQLGNWLSRPSAEWVRRRYRERHPVATRPTASASSAAAHTRPGD